MSTSHQPLPGWCWFIIHWGNLLGKHVRQANEGTCHLVAWPYCTADKTSCIHISACTPTKWFCLMRSNFITEKRKKSKRWGLGVGGVEGDRIMFYISGLYRICPPKIPELKRPFPQPKLLLGFTQFLKNWTPNFPVKYSGSFLLLAIVWPPKCSWILHSADYLMTIVIHENPNFPRPWRKMQFFPNFPHLEENEL